MYVPNKNIKKNHKEEVIYFIDNYGKNEPFNPIKAKKG